jgi:predicted transcriptional regulator
MELHLPPELEDKINKLAASTARRADQVALDLLASSVEYEHWFRSQVEKGLQSARDGRLIDHDEVAARFDARFPS